MRIQNARHDNQPPNKTPDTDWLDNHPQIFYPVLGGVLALVTIISLWLLWRDHRLKSPCFSRAKTKEGGAVSDSSAAAVGSQVGAKAGRVYLADLKYAKASRENAELSSPSSTHPAALDTPSTPSSKSSGKKLLKKSRKDQLALPASPLASQPPITHTRSASAPVASTTADVAPTAPPPQGGDPRGRSTFVSPASSFQFPSPLPAGPMPHYSLDSTPAAPAGPSRASQWSYDTHQQSSHPSRSYSTSFASTSGSGSGSWAPTGPGGWSMYSAPSSQSTPSMSGSVAYALTQAHAYMPPHPPEQAYHPPAPTISMYSQSSAAPSNYTRAPRPALSMVQPGPPLAGPSMHMPIPRPPRGASLGLRMGNEGRSYSSHAL